MFFNTICSNVQEGRAPAATRGTHESMTDISISAQSSFAWYNTAQQKQMLRKQKWDTGAAQNSWMLPRQERCQIQTLPRTATCYLSRNIFCKEANITKR